MTNYVEAMKNLNTTSIILCILLVVANWRIFEKAGEKGWKSLIPIYNVYVLWKIVGMSVIKFWIITILFIVSILGMYVSMFGLLLNSLSGGSTGGFGVLTTILPIIVLISFLYLLYTYISFCSNLSKSFGHSALFTIGLIIPGINTILMLILGFGSSEYVGPAGKE